MHRTVHRTPVGRLPAGRPPRARHGRLHRRPARPGPGPGPSLPAAPPVPPPVASPGPPPAPDPAAVYPGQQLIVVKTDGRPSPGGDAWKCTPCGAPAANAVGRGPAMDYPQAFKDG